MKMKIIGFILIFVQAISIFSGVMANEDFLGRPPVWYIGRFIFGIVGAILLTIAFSKSSKE